VDGSDVTITPVGDGEAIVTVTATNSRSLSAMQMVEVNVTDPPPAMPTVSDDLENMLFQSPDAAAQTIMLSAHFTGATEYSPSSSNPAVATATEAGGVLTVTPVGAGSALVTVTARNASGMVSDDFNVNVLAADMVNQPPMPKSDMTIGPFKRVPSTSNGAHELNLDKYFVDPDGSDALLTYIVTQDKDKEIQDPAPTSGPHNVIQVGGGTVPTDCTTIADGARENELPDGTDLADDMLWICYQATGTAEIDIVAVDSLGKKSDPVKVMITVGVNTGPTEVTTITLPTLNGAAGSTPAANRILKIGESRVIIDGVEFDDHFTDVNFNSGTAATYNPDEMLTLSVKYFPAATADGSANAVTPEIAVDPDTMELAMDKVGVRAVVSPSTWDGDPRDKFSLTLTGTKGTNNGLDTADARGHWVALIATDSFDQKTARVFRVMVNNPPKAEGAQAKDPKRLSTEDSLRELVVFSGTAYDGTGTPSADNTSAMLTLVEATSDTDAEAGGYFSDPDGPADLVNNNVSTGAGCLIRSTGGTDGVASFYLTEDADSVELWIVAKATGTKSVTISCKDSFEVPTMTDTLTVTVIGGTSGSRQ
jgi:hypothetical protein